MTRIRASTSRCKTTNAAFPLLQNPADQIFSMYGSHLQIVRQQHPAYVEEIVKVRALTKTLSLL
jgi:hypothetical protein